MRGATRLLHEPRVRLWLASRACLTPLTGGHGHMTGNRLGKDFQTYGVILDAADTNLVTCGPTELF